MRIIADLHIHSSYSRATSKNLSFENLEKYARIKGIDLLGTGDFQHPSQRKLIESELTEDSNGILWSKTKFPFVLQTEISFMFSQGGKRRAVHLIVLAPNKITADKIIEYLKSKGRLDYDGRPIFGIPCAQFVKDMKSISEKIEIIPAHCLLPNEKIICNQKIKDIESIKINDEVLTHMGAYRKVTNKFVREYKGKIYKIQPYYFREGINVTEEHPFLAIKTVKHCSAVGGLCKPNSTSKGKHICKEKHYEKYNPTWILAKGLEINDILLYPRIKKIEDKTEIILSEILNEAEFVTKEDFLYPKQGRQNKGVVNLIKINADFCRLAGYYLAEGYVSKKNNCLGFAFGKHEETYINDVINSMKNCFNINLTKKRERNGYELYFYSKALIRLFEKLFYEEGKKLRALSKKIPGWMLFLPLEKQVELFRGWWRGDAGVTVSEILAQQMKMVCLRLGIIPSIYKMSQEKQHKYNSKINERYIKSSGDTFFLQRLSFYEDKFNLLKEPEFKKFNTKLQKKHGWIDENYVYIPIKTISTNDYEGKVYNLEVEKDNSYVTPSAIVHNCMTPWFGLFGSDSGFDSLQECFGEETKHIYAVESGMSANPQMLWRLKENINILSFSDAHSFWPWRIGREATIFEFENLSYEDIINGIRTGAGLIGTIETPPSYGKYHFDGHRNCNFSSSPQETRKLSGICPICKNKLTIGVDYRIEQLAKEPAGFKPQNAKEVYELIPLHELIAISIGSPLESKKTWEVYNEMIEKFENEFNILLNLRKEEFVLQNVSPTLAELILLARENKLKVKPGYDGTYGQVILPKNISVEKVVKKMNGQKQSTLF